MINIISIIFFGVFYFLRYCLFTIHNLFSTLPKKSSIYLLDPYLEPFSNSVEQDSDSSTVCSQKSIAFKYDKIRSTHKDFGSRLVKIRAEGHFAETLLTGYSLIFIVNTFALFFHSNRIGLIFDYIIFIILIGLFFFRSFIISRYKVSISNHWAILEEK